MLALRPFNVWLVLHPNVGHLILHRFRQGNRRALCHGEGCDDQGDCRDGPWQFLGPVVLVVRLQSVCAARARRGSHAVPAATRHSRLHGPSAAATIRIGRQRPRQAGRVRRGTPPVHALSRQAVQPQRGRTAPHQVPVQPRTCRPTWAACGLLGTLVWPPPMVLAGSPALAWPWGGRSSGSTSKITNAKRSMNGVGSASGCLSLAAHNGEEKKTAKTKESSIKKYFQEIKRIHMESSAARGPFAHTAPTPIGPPQQAGPKKQH